MVLFNHVVCPCEVTVRQILGIDNISYRCVLSIVASFTFLSTTGGYISQERHKAIEQIRPLAVQLIDVNVPNASPC